MNPATSTQKPTLKQKLSNGFVLFTAIWSSVIVPITPSYAKMLSPDELPTLGSDSAPTDDHKVEQFIAEYSQSAAHFIADKKSTKDLADMAQDYARNKVTHTATNEINRWLSKTGNAKFSVDVDKKLSIKNTQLDWLIPWYDQPDLLLFSQHNIHRTDGRLQTNNGIGVRHFTPERMMGVNAFFDHDLSRYHSRLGFGAEYAQDFLKLSANTYLRTSSWRSASELDKDYNARPANGWDLQAEGWLPSYPNIGGNLKFEQYFGDDVALFGKDKRQKDPLATTVGVNWTPFSLVTLNAEHKISGKLSETSAKVQFTWALGKTLAEQLDPTKVGDSRRLMGNRYDFVNRNNNIVLEYQKKTLISLSLPAKIQGQSGDELPIINALTTKYPLDNLVVQAPEFLSAGGKINLNGTATQIKLPSYKVAMTEQERQKINLYRLTVTASDTKGNISPQATTLIEVTNSGVLSIRQNEITQKGNTLANGQDVNTLTIVARDPLGNVAPNANVTFTLPPELKLVTQKSTSSSMAFSNLFKKMQAAKSTTKQKYDIVTNMKGEASIQFTSLVTGEHRIQATAGKGTPIESIFVFIADTQQAHINAFNIISDNAVADGKAKNKINFHITDNNNHPIKGVMLHLDSKNATVTQVNPSDEQGNTEVDVSTLIAGSTNITASLNEQNVTASVNFVFGQLAHVVITNISQAAAGDDSTITISLTDTHGNPVSGADGTVMVNIDGTETPVIITETHPGSGIYIGCLPGQQMGKPTVTVTVDGQVSPSETMIIEPPKPISPANPNGTGPKGEQGVINSIIITPNKSHGLQSGDTLELTVTITDAFDNGLSGLDTNNINIGDHKGDSLHWTDNKDGSYTTTLPLTDVGNKDLTASINGITSPQTQIQVNNATGTININKVEITNITKPVAGADSTITIELTDKNGNPVVGETEITINIDGKPHILPVTEKSPGIYETTISGQHAGNHSISATINGEESPKELLIVDKPQPIQPKDPSGAGQKGEQGVVDKIEITTGNTSNLHSGDLLDITVSISDTFGNGLVGLDTNKIDIGNHKGDTLTWVDKGDGKYTTTITLTELGINDLTASINNQKTLPVQIHVNNATGKDKVSEVKITLTEQPAAGSSSILIVELTDKNSHPVVGEKEIIVDIDGSKHTLPAKESKPGIYEVTLPALLAGDHNISASVNGKDSNKNTLVVAQPSSIKSENANGTGHKGEKGVIDKIAITTGDITHLQSGDKLEVIVTLTDAFGNTLKDIDTSNITLDGHKAGSLTWVDKGDGSYSANITLAEAGSNSLIASINGHKTPIVQVQVGNATGTDKVSKIEILTIKTPPAGTEGNLTIKLTDKYGNPVIGEKEITVNIGGQPHKLAATEKTDGIYEITLPALQAGNHNISASVNGKDSIENTLVVAKPIPVKPKNPKGTGNKGEQGVVDKITIVTGNTANLQSDDKLEITVSIIDAFGNGLTELDTNNIKLEGYNGTLVWNDKGDGAYTTTLTLTEVGTKDLIASINGNKTPTKTIQVNYANGKDKVSKVVITKKEQPAAGSNSTITVTLTDKHGHPIVGEKEITVDIDGTKHTLPAKEGKPGIYEITLPALQAGDHKITATVNGQNSAKDTLEVKKPAPISSNNSSGTGNSGERGVINNITLATGDITRLQSGDKLDITVTLVDAFNNPLTAIDTSNIILDGYKTSSLKWTDNGDGSYTIALPLAQIGSNDLSASINGHKTPITKIEVNNATDFNKVSNIALDTISPSEAGEKQTITVKVSDLYQHPVTAISSKIAIKINGKLAAITLVDSLTEKGTYAAELPAKNSGKYTIEVNANNKTASQIWIVKATRTISVNKKDGSGVENQRGVIKTIELTSSSTNNLKSGQSLQLSMVLKDAFDNPLEGLNGSNIQLQHQQKIPGNLIWSDQHNGSYTTLLPLTKIGQDNLTVKVNQITTSPLVINIGNATGTTQIKQVKINSITTPAAGETSAITLALTDDNNQPITGIDNNVIASIDGAEELLKITETVNKGTYTGTLSGQKSGDHKVIVTVGGVKSAESTLTVTSPTAIANNNSGKKGSRGVVNTAILTVSPSKDLKSGDTLKLTAKLKDAFDNSLTGVDLAQSLTHKQTGKVTWVTQKDGTYTANLALMQLGQDHLFITANKIQSPTIIIDVKPQLGSNAIHKIDINNIVPAAAGAESTFTVSLTDKNGHPVTGITHVDVKIGQQQPLKIAVTQQANGSYIGTLLGQQSGSHNIVITANSQSSKPETLQVIAPDTVTATSNGAGTSGARGVVDSVTLSTKPSTDFKSGDNLQLTITLKDKFSNPLKGVSSASIILQQKQGSTVTWTDNNNGSYTATLPLRVLGSDNLKATVNSKESAPITITVANANLITQVDKVIIGSITASAAGKPGVITVKMQDANQLGVAQIANDIKITINDILADIKFTETSTKGTYTATLPASKTGSYNVKVTANSHTEQQKWIVNSPSTIKATQTDGSGAQDTSGVVKTVELAVSPNKDFKSGDTISLTVTLKDAFDNKLQGVALNKGTLSHHQTSKVTWLDKQDGTYTASFLLDTLGNDELIATANNINSQTLRILVEKAVGNSKVTQIKILAILEPIAGAESTLAVSLADSNGHPIEGIKEVTVKVGNNNTLIIPVSLQPNGNYIGTLPGQQHGKYDLVVSANNRDSVAKPWTVKKPSTLVAINGNGSGDQNKRGVVAKMLFTATPTANLKTSDKLKLTVTLKDYFDNTLRGIESTSIVINHKQTGSVVWKDNADGTYTTELLLKKRGKDTLTVTVNSVNKEENINVGSPEGQSAVQNVKLDILNSKLSVNDSVELRLTLTDSHGNGVEKVQTNDIQLEHNNTLVSKLTWLEKSAGIYTTTLPLHQQGKNTFVSRVNNRANTLLEINVSAPVGPTHVKTVELKTSTNQLIVGNKTELTLTLTDQWGNGVEGVNANDIVINDSHTKKNLTGLVWTSKGNGIYTASTIITMNGMHSLRATVNLIPSSNILINAKPSAGKDNAHSAKLTTSLKTITAGDDVILTFKVTDISDNPVINIDNKTIILSNGNNEISTTWNEDVHSLGLYTTTITLSEVGDHKLTASIGQVKDMTTVTANSPMGKNAVKTITISPIANSDAGQSSSLSISLTDAYNNPVKNISSGDITVTIGGKKQDIIFMEKNNINRYVAPLPPATMSNYKIIVEVNGQSETVDWKVNAPTEIPIGSYDKDGLRGSLDTLSITHSAKSNTVNSAEKVTLTVSLKDKFGNKLTGASSNLTLLTDLQSASIWKELSGGLYTQELTMNKLRKQSIQVAADKILSDKFELTVTPAKGASKVHKTTLETNEGTIEAGKEVLLTLALTDSVDNGVINIDASDIQLINNGKAIKATWATKQDGIYTTKQQLETVGNYQFKATVNNQPSRIQTVEATYPSGKDVVKAATLSTNSNTLDAGKKVGLTLELKDQYGNLVTGVTGVDIALKDSHTSEPIDSRSIAWNMESAGVYKATLPLTKVGKHTLTATVNNKNVNAKEITVSALRGTSNVNEIKLTSAKTSMNAGESTTLTLTLLDNYGNEVADVAPKDIQFKNTDSTITTKASWVKTPLHDSVYTAQITLEKVKQHTLSVEINKQVKNIEIDVKPLEGAKNVTKVELSVPAVLDFGTNANLQLNLKDKFGNGVVAVDTSDITLKLASIPTPINWTEGKEGHYTSSLPLTKAGVHSLEAEVNGHSSPVSITIENPKGIKNVADIRIMPSITADKSGKYTTKPGENFTLTFTLTDQYGNGVTELKATDISLMDTQTSSSVPITAWQENVLKKGEYTITVALTQAAQHELTTKVNTISEAIQISVTPFTDVKNIATIELTLNKNTIKIGENANFNLKIKDTYGNDVFVDTSDIKLFDTNNSLLQVRLDIKKDTFTHQYIGILNLAKSGKYTILASVGKANSLQKTITVETGAPVFGSGKSEFYPNTDNTNTQYKNAIIWLILKDSNGNTITGKKPMLRSNHWNQPQAMNEIDPGKYRADFNNNGTKGIVKITLDNSSIGYNGNNQSVQIINYGEMSITRLGVEKTYAIDEQFPHTGFAGTQFKINPSLGTASDYNWKVNQNWLSIDSKGIVTLNKQPEDSSKAKVTITGKAKDNNIKDMVYTFTLESWYTHNGKGTPKEALNMCQSPNKVMSIKNINLLSKNWGRDTAKKIIVDDIFWVSDWNFSQYVIGGTVGAVSNQMGSSHKLPITCVQEY